jgi:predicted O-linked N-acetylglucosamine transferase (SPINDLY family)
MTEITIDQALQTALEHHGAGRLAEAEAIYRQILARFPNHADALNLLGVLACQTDHPEAAIELIGRAIAINPAVADYQSNLGEAYRRSGRWDEAIVHLRRALELSSDQPGAENNLGLALKHKGRLDEAIAAFRRAITLKPGYAEAHSNLGNALKDQGQFEAAAESLRRALAIKPDHAAAHTNLGNVLAAQGRLDEALSAHHRAIQLQPGLAAAHNNLGNALMDQGRHDEATAAYCRAIELKPAYAEAESNLGNALKEQGRLDLAVAAYRRALAIRPDYAEAHSNLGIALKEQGLLDLAVAAHRRAIALKPEYAGAYSNLGNALKEQGCLDLAIGAYRRALALGPDPDGTHTNNLGNAFKEQGRLDEALACFRKAVELKPKDAMAASNLLMSLHYHPDYDAPSILAEHRQWARQYADPLAAGARPHTNDRSPDRKLRVGFVSADFREHPVGRSLLPIFRYHDRGQAEFIAYSDVRGEDEVTGALRSLADHWHSIVGVGDQDVADRIRADRIDILVDLALHSARNRLLVFARKPAPVQVTMVGMPATTGLMAMDYRLTDPYLDPPGTGDDAYSEQSIRLPHSFWCYQPPEEAPPVSELPARDRGFVTFACVNQFVKVSHAAIALWIEILHGVPTARLVIESQPGGHRETARALFEAGGIAADRVEFTPKLPRKAYFERFRTLDVGLDPFPYNGHTSSLDALWMGVPIITVRGRTAVGRGGVSMLSNLGLPELIAETPRQYVAIAVQWAGNLPGLGRLRAELRQRLQGSPLMDQKKYAADVDAAYRQMWKSWCSR